MKKNKIFRRGDVDEETVSANEYTGSLQKISLDLEEVKRFHDQFVGDD